MNSAAMHPNCVQEETGLFPFKSVFLNPWRKIPFFMCLPICTDHSLFPIILRDTIVLWIVFCAFAFVITVLAQMQNEIFSPKFGAETCVVVWNLLMKHWSRPRQTASLWTGPCRVIPKPAWPNCHARSALFLTNTSGQPIGPIFKGLEIQKGEQSTTEVNWHMQLIAKYFSWQT